MVLPLPGRAQISLSTAINLALVNSPKVKVAQADLDRAQAVLAESKETFVPAIAATAGVGKSTGAPLAPPVVFSISAQSLVFNSSQADYVRAARAGVESARLARDVSRSDVVEDTTSSYVALDNAVERRAVQTQALQFAHRLVTVAADRFAAGVDSHMEFTKARHTEAQLRLQQLLVEDEIITQSEHLARLTGLAARGLTTERTSIPVMKAPAPSTLDAPIDPRRLVGISAAFAAARAKQYTAHGDKRYLLRPQIAFSANYSRISTAFTTYSEYYPGFASPENSLNSLNFGVEVTVPILDMVHRAKARESAADAARSLYEAQSQQMQFAEARSKLKHSAAELAARRELAELDRELAQDQLDAVLVRLQASTGAMPGEQLTPKDEQNARLQERLRTYDMLTADLQLKQAEVMLMRQEGSLSNWLAAAVPAATSSGTDAAPASMLPLPATVGTTPGATPAGTLPSAVPTTGTAPTSLPSSPVTTPEPPTSPPSTPSSVPHP